MREPQFYDARGHWHVPKTPLTSAACVEYGGHCWYDSQHYMQGNGVQMLGQRCRHCPATRSGVSRDPYEWTYPEGQP